MTRHLPIEKYSSFSKMPTFDCYTMKSNRSLFLTLRDGTICFTTDDMRKLEHLSMDHNPEGINEAVECKADLVLCGHTHKGQFFPLTLFTRLSHEKNHFYGQATFEETQVVISAGTGYFQEPVRLGTNSEIVEIILKL